MHWKTNIGKSKQFSRTLLAISTLVAIVPLHSQVVRTIGLATALAPEHPCRTFQRPIQFFSENSLLILSGTAGYCYSAVDRLKLNLISMEGRVIASRKWPATDPGLVITPGRLLLVAGKGLEVDDQTLTRIQEIELPPHRFSPTVLVHKENTATVLLNEVILLYGGEPLTFLGPDNLSDKTGGWPGFEFANGQKIVRNGASLKLLAQDGSSTTIGNLEWAIQPCTRYVNCQAYEAGTHIEVSSGLEKRVLVMSNGSRFPISDAAGLFPYFRLEVFDANSKKSLYREEHITRTGERYACISPQGDLLATTDGRTVIVQHLP